MSENDEVCKICGAPSEVGCHYLQNDEVCSDYYCLKCYAYVRKGKEVPGYEEEKA